MTGTQEAYARHRKSLGLRGGTRAAVQKAIATKRIQIIDGKIDFAQADSDWEKNSNKRQQRTARRVDEKLQTSAKVVQPTADAGDSFLEAQRRREWLRVQKEEMELSRRRGELLDLAEVEKGIGEMLTAFRNRLLLMPDKLAPRVAVIADILECRALIERDVREALAVLSEYKANAA